VKREASFVKRKKTTILIYCSLLIFYTCISKNKEEESIEHLEKAISYLKSHHYEKAKIESEKAITKDPQNPYGHYFLGASYYFLKDLDNARFKYLRATSLDSNFLYPYIELARIHSEEGKFIEAQMYSDEAVGIISGKKFIKNPALDYQIMNNDMNMEFEVYFQRAEIAIVLEDFNEAKTSIKKALETQEKSRDYRRDANLLLVYILIIENKIPEALDTLTNISDKNSVVEKIREIIKEIVSGTTDHLAFKHYYFGMREMMRNQEHARSLFEKAYTISPYFTQNNYVLVQTYRNRHFYDLAIEICLKVIEHNTRDLIFRPLLVEIFESELRFKEAQKILKDLERILIQEKITSDVITRWKQRINDKKLVRTKIEDYITLIQKHDMIDLYNLQSDFSKARINEYTFGEQVKEHWPHPIILHTIDSIDSLDPHHMLVNITVHRDERKKINLLKKSFIFVREKDAWTFLAPEDESIQEIYLDQRKDLKDLIPRYTLPDVHDDHGRHK